jgi:hypothetical protein
VTWIVVLAVVLALALGLVLWRNRALLHDSGKLAVRLVKHPDVPRPLRWLLVVAVMPIPGPFEEIAGGLAVLLLIRLRPGLVTETWREVRVQRLQLAE